MEGMLVNRETETRSEQPEEFRLDPEERLCPEHDQYSVRLRGLPSQRMGVRVIDNCPEEHQQ